MNNIFKIYTGLIFIIISFNSTAAVKIVECEDIEGNTSFHSTCPSGTNMVNEKNISTGSKSAANNKPVTYETNSSSISAIMYTITDCSPCDAVRELLQIKNIPLTEKNVDGNIELQAELNKLNGSLNVPITLIGDKKLSGYNRTEILAALKATGWKDPNDKVGKDNAEK